MYVRRRRLVILIVAVCVPFDANVIVVLLPVIFIFHNGYED